MSEIDRRPAELAPLSPELSPQVMVWAKELRAQFTALGMSISLFSRLHPIDKGSVSRYLNGKRVPADRWFLDQVLALRASAGTAVTDEVRAHLVDLQMAALKVAHPHEYRIRKVSDELEIAVTSWKEAERYAQTLERQLTERNGSLQHLVIENERLRAAWDHDRTRYDHEISYLSEQLKLARDRTRQAELRVQVLEELLDELDSRPPVQGHSAGAIHEGVHLQRATALLAEAITLQQVVDVVWNIGRTMLTADRATVALLDANGMGLEVIRGEGALEGPDEFGEWIPLSMSSVMTMALNSHRLVLAESPESFRAQLREAGGDEGALDNYLSRTDERAWIGLPLLVAGGVLGALEFSFTRPRNFSQEEEVFLRVLAEQGSLAVQRAQLFEHEHRTAEMLQRSLLPERLPEVPGLTLVRRFMSSSRNTQVGGDWYDAFAVQDGRIAVVVGEFTGRGVKAAAGMGRIRNAVRALSLTNPPPAAVLTGLDRVFDAIEDGEQVATLAYLIVEPGTGEGTIGLAGHPPPLLVSPEGPAVLFAGQPGTPLGWPVVRRQARFRIPPGHTAVLYSDGLVTNRKRGLDAGLIEICNVATEASPATRHNPDLLVNFLVDRMMSGYEPDDDITVLAIHVPPR
ncbi:hypothetical protein Skr01_47360 [Sphaerisporangium krabiense]|uniref:Serine phosphatase RsbU (Regulator of sigma subunit) n=1 Tax=Sphaerisporangium krabiense TaxID=763782 RepID=A0A7W8Z1X0_9ACTN|nr:SpoIIE family protein phosphatase [Sphaerisporangium krabiense]MBB5625847.1 serine phosphatase RsbU (regulator of sigma subunit) [Sphaerisporangium krabiense]GII64651.1 hypothetical protein Skr01_47360 [Sphaerisporangium krabiense]